MLNDKVLLTYKRKRFSFQTDFAHDTKAINLSPNTQRGSSWTSSPKSECDAHDEKLKNHHSEKCQCSTCNSRYGFTESMRQHVPATKGMIQSQMTGQKDTGPMVLRSRKVLSSIKVENTRKGTSTLHVLGSNMKDIIQMDSSGIKSGLDYMTCADESSTTLLAVHDRMGNPINLNMNLATEGGYSCGYPEIGAKMSLHSDNGDDVLCNDGALKDHSSTHLITFSRRAKTKQDACERITDRNLKIVEKQSFSAICSSRVVGAKFSCEDSSQKHIFEERVNCAPTLENNCVDSSSQVDVADEMANVKVDATSDCTAEVCTGSKIKNKFETISDFPIPAAHASQELSKEFSEVEENDARSKEIEWLEGLDIVLRQKREERGIDYREGIFNPIMPNKSAEQSLNNPHIAIDFVNPLTILPDPSCVKHLQLQLKAEKSTYSDFFGRYFPSNPSTQLDLNTAAAPSSSHMHDLNPCFFKPKMYSREWSEEELDFLWLGVRRHGVDNWNDILRNPELHFAESRRPEDLALQWEQEEKKLFDGILFRPARFSNPKAFSTPLLPEGTSTHAAKNHPPASAETKLSLGDVYLHRENIAKSNQSGVTYPLTSECSSTRPLLVNYLSIGASIRQKKSSGSSSTIYKKPTGLPASSSTNLPHWLKEACSSHPSPSDLPVVSCKDARGRGILKRKSMVSSKKATGIIKIEEASTFMGESVLAIQLPAYGKPALGIGDLCDHIPVPIATNDLLVIDSDVSSEETISDDQNGRPL